MQRPKASLKSEGNNFRVIVCGPGLRITDSGIYIENFEYCLYLNIARLKPHFKNTFLCEINML